MLVLGMWALWRSPTLSRFFAWSGLTLLAVVLSLRIGLSHYYVVPLGLVAMATWSWLSDQRIRADFRCIVVTR
jgi:hypothetical protein